MNKQKHKVSKSNKRKKYVRKKVYGDPNRPRLTVFRSARHIYAQIIDDDSGSTLAAASTSNEKLRNKIKYAGNSDAAANVGQELADKALAVGIRQVRFDRNGYKFHGRVRVLAEAARKAGLVF